MNKFAKIITKSFSSGFSFVENVVGGEKMCWKEIVRNNKKIHLKMFAEVDLDWNELSEFFKLNWVKN